MNKRVLVAAVGWLAAALVAIAVGVAAVSLLGEGISDSNVRPMTSAQVRRALESSPEPAETPGATPTSPAPTGTPTSPGSGSGQPRLFDTAGGNVIARCAGTGATLSSWSPNQGFHAEYVVRGPAPTASLTFESDKVEVLVTVDCPAGTPQVHTRSESRGGDDGGGGGHRGKG